MLHEAAMPTLLAAAGPEIPLHKLPPPPPPHPSDGTGDTPDRHRNEAWTHGCYFVTATQRPVLGCVRLTQRAAELYSWDSSSSPAASPQQREESHAVEEGTAPYYELVRRVLFLTAAPQHAETELPTSRIPTSAPPSDYADAPTVALATAVCLTMCPRTHIMTLYHHGQPVAALRGVGVGSHVPASIPFVDPSRLRSTAACDGGNGKKRPTAFPIGDGATDLGVAQIVSDAPNLLADHLCAFLDARTTAAKGGRGGFALDRTALLGRGTGGGGSSNKENGALGSISPINRAPSPHVVDMSSASSAAAASPVSRAQQVRELLKRSLNPPRPEGVAADGGWQEASRVVDGPSSEHQQRRQREQVALDAVSRIGKPTLTSPPRQRRGSVASPAASSTVRRTTSGMTSRERVSARRSESLRATGRQSTPANEPARQCTTSASSWQRHADPVLLDRAYQAALRHGYPRASDAWQVGRRPGQAPSPAPSKSPASTGRGASTSGRRGGVGNSTRHYYVATPRVNDATSSPEASMTAAAVVTSPSRMDRSLARPSRYTDRPQPMQIGRHEAARELHVDDDVMAVLEAHSLHDMTSRFSATATAGGDGGVRTPFHNLDDDDDAAGLADLGAMDPAARRKVLEALLEANRVMDEQLDNGGEEAW
jgi:hypothetical protein